eukprot:TRINITY_DN10050_c0_g1_i1.p1 TRINITY_DN10050_c0_g1~~TRINITY_DN10050_c0_g1_i1.p1  ORF type:complete len:301 (-),score=76.59 TRINITY_DN10050_c0_g1_i1:12-914(-)
MEKDESTLIKVSVSTIETSEDGEIEGEEKFIFISAPPPPPPPPVALPYIRVIEKGGKTIADGILSGSNYIANAMYNGKERFKASVEPRDDPIEIPKPVLTAIDTTSRVIPYISNATTKVIETIAEVGATATTKIMGEQDPLAKPTVLSSIASTTMNEGWRVWSGLTTAGSQIFVAGKDSVCEIVNHRFGLAASQATQDSITLGKDIVTTTSYIKQAGVTTATMTFSKVLSKTKDQPLEIELDVLSIYEEKENTEDSGGDNIKTILNEPFEEAPQNEEPEKEETDSQATAPSSSSKEEISL